MDKAALLVGWVTICFGLAFGVVISLAYIFAALNKLQKAMVIHFYGWKYFLEFAEWYRENKKTKTMTTDEESK